MGVAGQARHLAMVTAVPRRKTTAVRGEGIVDYLKRNKHAYVNFRMSWKQVAVLEALAPEAEMATKHTKETIPTAVKVEHHRPDAAAFETMVCWQQENKQARKIKGGNFQQKTNNVPYAPSPILG